MEKYDLQNAILKKIVQGSAENAIPLIGAEAAKYSADKAASDAATIIADQQRQQYQKQFFTRLLSAQKQLSDFTKNNTAATLITAANIPVQYAADKKSEQEAERRAAANQEILNLNRAAAKRYADAADDMKRQTMELIQKYSTPTQALNQDLTTTSLAEALRKLNKTSPYLLLPNP